MTLNIMFKNSRFFKSIYDLIDISIVSEKGQDFKG